MKMLTSHRIFINFDDEVANTRVEMGIVRSFRNLSRRTVITMVIELIISILTWQRHTKHKNVCCGDKENHWRPQDTKWKLIFVY